MEKIVIQVATNSANVSGDLATLKKTLKKKSSGIISGLYRVEWRNAWDERGLQADWRSLYTIWLFEQSPSELGVWSKNNTHVTITRRDYIRDLRSRVNFTRCIQRLQKQFPNLQTIKKGDRLRDKNNKPGLMFLFTGRGTAIQTGPQKYTALEWYLGSYRTNFTVMTHNKSKRMITFKVSVSNKSHWQSATRMPKSFQKFGLPKFLVTSRSRKSFGPGGSFTQHFTWSEIVTYDANGLIENHYRLGYRTAPSRLMQLGRGLFPVRR